VDDVRDPEADLANAQKGIRVEDGRYPDASQRALNLVADDPSEENVALARMLLDQLADIQAQR
jgi:hypothetical protein